MSSYFFGGFSAYRIEPSGRRRNHCGCSLSQGWSGEHCTAKSSATSMPYRLQAATKPRKSSSVPSSGCTASWPPSAAADRIGAAGIALARAQRVVAALAVGVPDRMDRREIDDVEAQRRDVGQARDAIVEGAVPARHAALAARHHFVPGAVARQRPVSDERKEQRPRQVGPQLALRHRVLQFIGQQRRGVAGLRRPRIA